MYSPLWKTTHQTPSVLCTSPFEKSSIESPSVLCTPPFEKSPIKPRRFYVLPPPCEKESSELKNVNCNSTIFLIKLSSLDLLSRRSVSSWENREPYNRKLLLPEKDFPPQKSFTNAITAGRRASFPRQKRSAWAQTCSCTILSGFSIQFLRSFQDFPFFGLWF